MELSGSDGNPLGWRLGRYPPATRGPDACGMRPLSLRNRMFNFVSSQLNFNHHVCLVATVSESLGGAGGAEGSPNARHRSKHCPGVLVH